MGHTFGHAFDEVAAPVVTAGGYSAGDIMGTLMEFYVSDTDNSPVIITGMQFSFKSAVVPSLQAILFEADPTATTKTDNAPYTLAVADTFKVRKSIGVNALGGVLTDHGTPNTIELEGLNIVMRPAAGTKKIYMLLVDLTGVTLGSVSDLQVRVTGVGA